MDQIIVWESSPFSVEDGIEMSIFGNFMWGTLQKEKGEKIQKGRQVKISVAEVPSTFFFFLGIFYLFFLVS